MKKTVAICRGFYSKYSTMQSYMLCGNLIPFSHSSKVLTFLCHSETFQCIKCHHTLEDNLHFIFGRSENRSECVVDVRSLWLIVQKELKIKACCIIIVFVPGSRIFLAKAVYIYGAGICLVLGSSCH